jgi:hypothetical protein
MTDAPHAGIGLVGHDADVAGVSTLDRDRLRSPYFMGLRRCYCAMRLKAERAKSLTKIDQCCGCVVRSTRDGNLCGAATFILSLCPTHSLTHEL